MKAFKNAFLWPVVSVILAWILAPVLDGMLNAYVKLTLIYVCVNIILALGLNLVNGLTGQFSLGHAGFMAAGAYTSAFLSTKWQPFGSGDLAILNFPIYAICGGWVAAIAGYAVGLPSLRLKGDYLAIVTLGFGEIIRIFLLNTESVGGARGFYGIPGMGTPGETDFIYGFGMSATWVIITIVVLWRIMHSTHGRAFLSVREDEIAAESMGVNTTNAKVTSFVVSSFFAGIAGSLFAHYARYLNPATFSFIKSVDVLIMIVLGGLGSFTGSVLAAILITILPEALRPLKDYTGVDLRMVIYSFALILLMLNRPQGLMGEKEIFHFWRKKNG